MMALAGFLKRFAPLVSDTDPKGWWKLSAGRFLLVLVISVGCYMYVAKQMDLGVGLCSVIFALLSYNGFSKTPVAGGNGGFSTPSQATTATAAPAAAVGKDSDKQPEAEV